VAGEDIGRCVREDIRRIEDFVLQSGLDDTSKPRLTLIRHSLKLHPFSRAVAPKSQDGTCFGAERLAR
jgi:hypothetical protein